MGQNRKGKQPVTEQEKQKYQEYVKEMTPTHNLGMQMFNAFICGGIICLIGQIILNYCLNTLGMEEETAASWCSLLLILLSVVLTALHLYGKIVKWGGAGALVPITGFANSVAATAIEFKAEGWVFGVGSKIFTIAGPVILYGIVSSWVLGLIYWIMKCMGAA
ncbi:MAG: SpoVA/SpoVAEb family sporulation membrane protein [Lachnospiraceae bacterium]